MLGAGSNFGDNRASLTQYQIANREDCDLSENRVVLGC
jgi:hypothetical protein